MRAYPYIVCLILLFNSFSSTVFAQADPATTGTTTDDAAQQAFITKLKNKVGQAGQLVDDAGALITKIKAAYENVKENNSTMDFILNGKDVDFPVSILPGDGRQENQIILNQIVFLEGGAYAEVFFRLQVSDKGDDLDKYLYFAAQRVGFTKSGGFTGELELVLLNPHEINLGEDDKIRISVKEGTYVSFGCDGFEEVFLSSQLIIDRQLATPEDAEGNPINEDVIVDLDISFSDWENWLFTVSLDHFQFAQLPGYSVSATNVSFDHSELRNPESFEFPEGHQPSVEGALWKGFYAEHISLIMPNEFKQEGSGSESLIIEAHNFIIDDEGVSGLISAGDFNNPILSLDKGRIGEWNFSVEKVAIRLENNTLTAGTLEGEVVFPTSKAGANEGEDGRLGYSATIARSTSEDYKLDYLFTVETRSDLNFDIWKAEMALYEGSRITIVRVDGEFTAEACLNGSLALGSKLGKQDQSAPVDPNAQGNAFSIGVEFTQLKIKSKGKPMISLDGDMRISTDGGAFAKFPLQIRYAGIINPSASEGTTEDGELGGLEGSELEPEEYADGEEPDEDRMIGLELGLSLSFMEGKNSFGADAGLIFWAQQKPDTRKWKLEKVQVTEMGVDVDNKAFSIKGNIKFFDDPLVYGKGFNGCIEAKFKPGIEIGVNARFGKMDDAGGEEFRYWYVDASVKLPTAIPIFPAVGINGFTGGAYYHLRPQPLDPFVVDGCGNTQKVDYVPDIESGLGIKAGLGLVSLPTDKLFSGNVLFEINFNTSGGVRYVGFSGMVEVMKQPAQLGALDELSKKATSDKGAPAKGTNGANPTSPPDLDDLDAAVAVDWLTYYDVENKVFSGTFNTYLNMGVVAGAKGGNRAGTVSIYISRDKWYFYMGQPVDMIEITFKGLVKIGAYMVVGSELPTPPIAPMPPEIDFSPMDNFNYDMLSSGGGFAFGARASVDINIEAPVKALGCEGGAYIKAGMQVGFDVLMSKSYEPVICDGEERGAKNWYATGQVFILGYVKIGAYAKCLGIDYDFTLVELTAYAAMFAQLPNPAYMKGKFSAKGEFIGIEFDAEFEVEINEPCIGDVASATELRLIEFMTPNNRSEEEEADANELSPASEVDVFTIPSVTLVYPNFRELSIPDGNAAYDEDDLAPKIALQVRLDETNRSQVSLQKLTVGVDQRPAAGATGSEVAGEYTWNQQNSVLSFTPTEELDPNTWYRWFVHVKTKVGEGWLVDGDMSQTQVNYFKTGELNTTIPDNNIAYSYPLPQMDNFYPAESNKGYVKNSVVPNSLLGLADGLTWEVQYLKGNEVVFRSRNVIVNDSPNMNQFEFEIPSDLELKTKYELRIVKTVLASAMDAPNYEDAVIHQGDNPFYEGLSDIEIVAYNFTTSSYHTFNEKFAQNVHQSINVNGSQGVVTMNLSELETSQEDGSNETLSRDELYGRSIASSQFEPLVRGTIGDISSGFSNVVNNLVYNPIAGYDDGRGLTYDYNQALFIRNGAGGFTISYELPKHIKYTLNRLEDYYYFLAATNQGSPSLPSNEQIPDMEAGHYNYELHYYLPGQSQPNSTAVLGFDLNETIEL